MIRNRTYDCDAVEDECPDCGSTGLGTDRNGDILCDWCGWRYELTDGEEIDLTPRPRTTTQPDVVGVSQTAGARQGGAE